MIKLSLGSGWMALWLSLLPPLLVPRAEQFTDSANTAQQPSTALPFWVEDRIRTGEKRLHGFFVGTSWEEQRQGLWTLSSSRRLGKSSLQESCCDLPSGFFGHSGSKALVRTYFQGRLRQFLTHIVNSGWLWRLCPWEGQAGTPPSTVEFTVYGNSSSSLRGSCCVQRGEWSPTVVQVSISGAAAASRGPPAPPCLLILHLHLPFLGDSSEALLWETVDLFKDF